MNKKRPFSLTGIRIQDLSEDIVVQNVSQTFFLLKAGVIVIDFECV